MVNTIILAALILTMPTSVTTRQVYQADGTLSVSFVREEIYGDEIKVYSAPGILEYRETPVYLDGKLVHVRREGPIPRPDEYYPSVGYVMWKNIYPSVIEDYDNAGILKSVRVPGLCTVDVLTHQVTHEHINTKGQLTWEGLPDGRTRSYYYNDAGNITTMNVADAHGVRLEKHAWFYVGNTVKHVSYYYPGPVIWPRWIDTKVAQPIAE